MEKSPFDLNLAIQRWREDLAQSPAFRSENLNELESHLRDSIATLQIRELSAEEAFIVAAKRIGKGGLLEKEFGKVNSKAVWLDRVLWMLIGIQVWGLASGLVGSVARNILAFGWRNTNHPWKESGLALPVTLFVLVQGVAFAASIGLCWWLVFRKGGNPFRPIWSLVAAAFNLHCVLHRAMWDLNSCQRLQLQSLRAAGLVIRADNRSRSRAVFELLSYVCFAVPNCGDGSRHTCPGP